MCFWSCWGWKKKKKLILPLSAPLPWRISAELHLRKSGEEDTEQRFAWLAQGWLQGNINKARLPLSDPVCTADSSKYKTETRMFRLWDLNVKTHCRHFKFLLFVFPVKKRLVQIHFHLQQQKQKKNTEVSQQNQPWVPCNQFFTRQPLAPKSMLTVKYTTTVQETNYLFWLDLLWPN